MLDELKKTISSTIRQDYAGHCVYLRLPKRGKTKHQNKASPRLGIRHLVHFLPLIYQWCHTRWLEYFSSKQDRQK